MKKILLLSLLLSFQFESFSQLDKTGLLLYLKFDNDFQDQSGNQIKVIDSNMIFTTDRFNNSKSALYSSRAKYPDFKNIYLKVIDFASFEGIHKSDFTISAWIKYDGDGSYSTGTVFHLDQLWVINSQYINFGGFKWNDPEIQDFNKWNHMVWTTEKDSIVEFLNGIKVRKISKASVSSSILNDDLILFKELNASIDDFMIFNRAMDSTEIAQLYKYVDGPVTNLASNDLRIPISISNPVSEDIVLPAYATIMDLVSINGEDSRKGDLNTLKVSGLSSGIYVLTYKIEEKYYRKRIVIKQK